jgi:hypothetical protein
MILTVESPIAFWASASLDIVTKAKPGFAREFILNQCGFPDLTGSEKRYAIRFRWRRRKDS